MADWKIVQGKDLLYTPFSGKEWWVVDDDGDFGSIGPFDTEDEAVEAFTEETEE